MFSPWRSVPILALFAVESSNRSQVILDLSEDQAHNLNMARNFDPKIGVATRWRKGQPSPNPGGRPKSRLLSEALRTRLAEVKLGDPQQRTYAELIAESLIDVACSGGPGSVAAANEIADRLEGRSPQHIAISDFTAELHTKSDEELRFHLQHDRWPTDEERILIANQSTRSA